MLSFIFGLIIGGCFGIAIMCIMSVSSKVSREEEKWNEN